MNIIKTIGLSSILSCCLLQAADLPSSEAPKSPDTSESILTIKSVKHVLMQALKTGGVFLMGSHIITPFAVDAHNKFYPTGRMEINREQGKHIAYALGTLLVFLDCTSEYSLSAHPKSWFALFGTMVFIQMFL